MCVVLRRPRSVLLLVRRSLSMVRCAAACLSAFDDGAVFRCLLVGLDNGAVICCSRVDLQDFVATSRDHLHIMCNSTCPNINGIGRCRLYWFGLRQSVSSFEVEMNGDSWIKTIRSLSMSHAFGGTWLESAVGSRALVLGDERIEHSCVGTLAGGAVPSSTGDGRMEPSCVGTLAPGGEVPRMTGVALIGVLRRS